MNDQSGIVGLWCSAGGAVLWIRRGRGYSVRVSVARTPISSAIQLGVGENGSRTVIGRWDDYDGELRIPLPRLPYGAELILNVDYSSTVVAGWPAIAELTGGVSMDGVAEALNVAVPDWLFASPYRRVPERSWSSYAIVASTAGDSGCGESSDDRAAAERGDAADGAPAKRPRRS